MLEKILIVEDDRTTSLMLQKYIRDLGYAVLDSLASGEAALNYQRISEANLVIMDITLEGELDGIETAKILHEKYNLPIIYITSSVETETVERIKKTNPYGYIIKPIDRKELKASFEMAFLRYDMDRKLVQSEQKLLTILNSIGDAVLVTDYDGKLVYVNPAVEYLLDMPESSTIGRMLRDIIKIEHGGLTESNQGITYLVSSSTRKIPVDYTAAPIMDTYGELAGTVIVLRDVTERISSEIKIKESIAQLRTAMGGVIQAMSRTVETRDPYTAGHQKRVADLARTIATKMNLDLNTIEGVRMAGVIHDLGKISVPAEILSKPGRLNPIEFSLIKIHPQIGYDILKTIDFPWPVADIVHQHHERMDGSGYPKGLKGHEILIESKIISVADVVEAMATHRPYRASLGIEVALNEIIRNKGTIYDPVIVDVCVSLFRDDGYIMEY